MGILQEALAIHQIQLCNERIKKAFYIQNANRLAHLAELHERQHFKQLIQRAVAAG